MTSPRIIYCVNYGSPRFLKAFHFKKNFPTGEGGDFHPAENELPDRRMAVYILKRGKGEAAGEERSWQRCRAEPLPGERHRSGRNIINYDSFRGRQTNVSATEMESNDKKLSARDSWGSARAFESFFRLRFDSTNFGTAAHPVFDSPRHWGRTFRTGKLKKNPGGDLWINCKYFRSWRKISELAWKLRTPTGSCQLGLDRLPRRRPFIPLSIFPVNRPPDCDAWKLQRKTVPELHTLYFPGP